LAEHFLQTFRQRHNRSVEGLHPDAMRVLLRYRWPGNVRELEHVIERAVVMARGREIDLEHLPLDIAGAADELLASDARFRPLAAAVRQFEREYIVRAIREAGGVRQKAAELLGISRKNLWEKLKAHGLSDEDRNGHAEG